jgi:quercetin dioxygenase-like cupin family protein
VRPLAAVPTESKEPSESARRAGHLHILGTEKDLPSLGPVEQQRKIATSLVRMDPGTHFPAHRHGGPEEVFVLEGDLVLEGQKMKPGDYCHAEIGTIHSESYTESGCLFLLKASQLDEIFE